MVVALNYLCEKGNSRIQCDMRNTDINEISRAYTEISIVLKDIQEQAHKIVKEQNGMLRD